ncbi:MAG: hypothetical protein HOP03_02295 [Lysobacter sp.]|nr:hypothetical protein [Lysobacter sp.]
MSGSTFIPTLVCGLISGAAFLPVYGACFALFARRATARDGRQAALLLAGTLFAMLACTATIVLPLWLADLLPLGTQSRNWVLAFFAGVGGYKLAAFLSRRTSSRT